MFGKTETIDALKVAMTINRDETSRCCSFYLCGTTDAITMFVYPDNHSSDCSWGYTAYQTEHYISYQRIQKNGIEDDTKFNTFKELLDDVKGAGT